MVKFTPGPWRYNDRLGLVSDINMELIATCEPAGTSRAINNARFIAKAPEMYAALKDACKYCAMCSHTVCEKCRIKLVLDELEKE